MKFPTHTETKLIPSFEEAIRVGLVKTDGIILTPMSGSIAQKSGIRDGDIVLSIDGKSILKPEDMIQKVQNSIANLDFVLR
jgi:type II secretory pathway component PulC